MSKKLSVLRSSGSSRRSSNVQCSLWQGVGSKQFEVVTSKGEEVSRYLCCQCKASNQTACATHSQIT